MASDCETSSSSSMNDVVDDSTIDSNNEFQFVSDCHKMFKMINQTEHEEFTELIKDNPVLLACDKNGDTALHCAVNFGNKKICRVLHAAGVDINAKNDIGETALHYMNRPDASFRFFVKNKADIDACDNNGETVLFRAVYNDCYKFVPALIDAGADVNFRNKKGETPLFKASSCNFCEIITILFIAGAKIDVVNNKGENLLHEAAGCEDTLAAEFYIAHGIDINSVDNNGNTALHHAVMNDFQTDVKFVQFLLASGIDEKIKNNEGDTAIDLAKLIDNQRMIDVISSTSYGIHAPKELSTHFQNIRKRVELQRESDELEETIKRQRKPLRID